MNGDPIKRLDGLLDAADQQKKKALGLSRASSFIYVLLAVFVVVYTGFLYNWIKASLTNDSVSAIAKNIVSERLEALPQALDMLADEYAPGFADAAIIAIYDRLPFLESKAKALVDEYASAAVTQIKTSLFPQFQAIIKEHADEIHAATEVLSNEAAAKELASILARSIAEEIDYSHGLITSEAQSRVDEITAKLSDLLKKPDSQLTNKEFSQKRLIVSWLFLVDKGQGLDKICQAALRRLGYNWEFFLKDLGFSDFLDDASSQNLEPDIE